MTEDIANNFRQPLAQQTTTMPQKVMPNQVISTPSKLPLIFMSLFLLVVSIIAGYLYMNSRSGEEEVQDLSPGVSSTVDSMSDWKSYTSKELGFEVKYPPTVRLGKESYGRGRIKVEFLGDEATFTVSLARSTGQNLDEYYFMDAPIASNTTMAGLPANTYESSKGYCFAGACGAPFIAVVSKKDPYMYELTFFGDTTLSDIEKSILSSFQFIQITQAETDILTYQDPSGKFSFAYPKTSTITNSNNEIILSLSGKEVKVIPDSSLNWGEGMSQDALAKVYVFPVPYPDNPSKGMYPDSGILFWVEFQSKEEKIRLMEFVNTINQIASTVKFVN